MKVFILLFFIPMSLLSNEWILKHRSDNEIIESIHVPDTNNCYILAQDGVQTRVYKSTDQGGTWDAVYKCIPSQEGPPYLINALDGSSPLKGYYYMSMEESGYIKVSNDDCKTFHKVDLKIKDPINEVEMYNTNIGIALSGSHYFITNDGWQTFNQYSVPDGGYFQFPVFKDMDTIIAFFYSLDSACILIFDIESNKYSLERFPDNYTLLSLDIVNNSLWFACGLVPNHVGDQSYDLILRTSNAGKKWEKVLMREHSPIFGLQDIAFKNEKVVIAVGQFGKIVLTTDGGDTWEYMEVPEDYDPPTMLINWIGEYPVYGTFTGRFYRLEGENGEPPVFQIPTSSPPIIQTKDFNFGAHDTSFMEGISAKLKIYNKSDIMDLIINHYSAMTDSAFSSDLPVVDSLNPIVIKPLGFFEYTVSFKPNEIKEYRDSIVFFSNAKDSDNVAYLNGKGIDTIEVGVDERTIQKRINVLQSEKQLLISIQDEKFRKYKLQIFDILGNVVKEEELNSGIGSLFVEVDISSLSNGTYFYMISTGGVVAKTGKAIRIHN